MALYNFEITITITMPELSYVFAGDIVFESYLLTAQPTKDVLYELIQLRFLNCLNAEVLERHSIGVVRVLRHAPRGIPRRGSGCQMDVEEQKNRCQCLVPSKCHCLQLRVFQLRQEKL